MLVIAFISIPLLAEDTIIDITKIASQPKNKVDSILKLDKCSNSKYGNKCSYNKEQYEIVYINGKSDWITINKLGDIKYSETALQSIGLPKTGATFKNDNTIRWTNISGFLEISLFPGQNGKADYIYIKTVTK